MDDLRPPKIPHVQRVKSPDGKVRLYFRKGTHREGPLSSPDGSAALRAEVDGILQRLGRLKKRDVITGTVSGLLLAYPGDGAKSKPSAAFYRLAASTQAEYLRLSNEIREDCADVLVSDVNVPWLRDLMDAWSERGYKAANDRRQVLRNALASALQDGRITSDPFAIVKKVARPHSAGEPHPAWEDPEVDAAIAEALRAGAPGLARAIAIGRWGGFRRGTICRLPLSARVGDIDADGRPYIRLLWMTEKRKVVCDKPEDGNLTRVIDTTPNRASTIAYDDNSNPWKERALSRAIERLTLRLRNQGKISRNLTFHGLRHARGVELAEARATDSEIMAQLEHATEHMARLYRRQAKRRKLARAAQQRIDEERARQERKGHKPAGN